jgi:ribosomal protein L11 methyltransferase
MSGQAPAVRYPYLAIDVYEDQADLAGALLFELGAGGIEQRDATTLAPGTMGRVTLIASFDREQDARTAAGAVPSAWSPRVEEVIGDAWRDEWKKYFAPFQIARDIVVAPPWSEYAAKQGEHLIVLEPGRAFGTGLHETTSLVAAALVDHAARFKGLSVLDVGCGSGILSLVALALGAAKTRAIDVDPDAVLVTRENAAGNAMAARLHADGAPVQSVRGRFATVVANIEARPLVELAPHLAKRVDTGGLLILSGILAPDVAPTQLQDVRHAYSALREKELRRSGEWVALVMSR